MHPGPAVIIPCVQPSTEYVYHRRRKFHVKTRESRKKTNKLKKRGQSAPRTDSTRNVTASDKSQAVLWRVPKTPCSSLPATDNTALCMPFFGLLHRKRIHSSTPIIIVSTEEVVSLVDRPTVWIGQMVDCPVGEVASVSAEAVAKTITILSSWRL